MRKRTIQILAAALLASGGALLAASAHAGKTLDAIKQYQHGLEQGDYAIAGLGVLEIDLAMAYFSARLAEKEAAMERFKSRDAVLRNSSHYFPLAVDNLLRDRQVPGELRALAQSLLRDALLLRISATAAEYGWLLGSRGHGLEVLAAVGPTAPIQPVGSVVPVIGARGFARAADQPTALMPAPSDESNRGIAGFPGIPPSLLVAPGGSGTS